jgi:hypothetical protein
VGYYYQDQNSSEDLSEITDAVIYEFNSSYQKLWASHFGGNCLGAGNDPFYYPSGYDLSSAIEIFGDPPKLYLVGYAGVSNCSNENPFPLYNPGNGAYFSNSNTGGNYQFDGFIARFDIYPILPLGIEGIEIIENNILVYPNPSSDFIKIDLPSSYRGGVYSIFNDIGELIKQQTLDTGIISLANLPAGYYILELRTNENTWRAKFIKP